MISVGTHWLSRSGKLVNVDFRGLTNLQEVGNEWLSYCHNLKEVDFRGLTSLEEVSFGWLLHCYKLENVFITETFSNNLKNSLPTYLQLVDSRISSLPYNEFKFYNSLYGYGFENNHFLSNSYTSKEPLIIRGEKWINVEHYIQAMKYRGPKATPKMIEYSNVIKNTDMYDIQILEGLEIINGVTKKNKSLKKVINKYKNISIRKDWDLAYIVVVIDGLYHKFNQYKNLKEKIMRIPDNTYIVDGSKESEENKLGKILTAFINVIKHGDCCKMSKELLLKIKY